MSVVQLAILITIFAPFILAVWVAFIHWIHVPANPSGPANDTDGFGSVRSRFAAETLNLEAQLRGAADSADELARPKFVRLDLAVDPEGTVRVDPSVLRGVLCSLIDTAIRSASSGQVLVTSLILGRQMYVRVVDDGVGTDQISRETDAREAGTLIALHGRTMAVEAGPGHGTTITIRLLLSAGVAAATSDFAGPHVLADEEV